MLADRTIVMMFSAAVSSSAASREKENATNAASSSSSLKQPPPYTATSAFISDTKRYMQAQAATKQELSFAPVEGNGAANRRRRQYTADASLSARRGSSDRSSGSSPPSYGVDDYYSSAAPETRNGQKEGFHWYGNEERPNKKSSGGVSDRYEKTGRTSDWGSEPRVHDADLAMAIAALEQPINTNDTLINSWFGIQRARKSILCASFIIDSLFSLFCFGL